MVSETYNDGWIDEVGAEFLTFIVAGVFDESFFVDLPAQFAQCLVGALTVAARGVQEASFPCFQTWKTCVPGLDVEFGGLGPLPDFDAEAMAVAKFFQGQGGDGNNFNHFALEFLQVRSLPLLFS